MYKVVLAVLVCVTLSCKSKKGKKEPFVPYQIFVQNDLARLDSSPLAIFAYTIDTSLKVVDSAIISKADFKTIAAQFYTPNMSDKEYFENFREDKYSDEVTEAFNFTYTPDKGKRTDLPIKSVIVGTSLEDASKFKSLFITKDNEQKQRQQMYWEAGKYCQITTVDAASGNIITKKYRWGK